MRSRLALTDLALCSLFAALIALCSWIAIPAPVPFTLQSLGVFAALTVLGGKRGLIAVLLYLLLGAVGVPVFAGFQGGIGVFFGATGGYLLGFVLAAVVYTLLAAPPCSIGRQAVALILGQLLCYMTGVLWFVAVYTRAGESIGFATAMLGCVIPFVVPDGIKLWLALVLGRRVSRHISF